MLNIFKLFGKIFGFKQNTKSENKEEISNKDSEAIANGFLAKKFDALYSFFENFSALCLVEYRIIREKLKDLSQTNYELGIKHLEEGNIKEATFRFKIIKKFWPDNYEAYYQLIYCLILQGQIQESKKIIDELLTKDPEYKEKIDQLLSIEINDIGNNSTINKSSI